MRISLWARLSAGFSCEISSIISRECVSTISSVLENDASLDFEAAKP